MTRDFLYKTIASFDTLMYPEEHISCSNYNLRSTHGFKYIELNSNEQIYHDKSSIHHILFLLEGKIVLYDKNEKYLVHAMEMIFFLGFQ